KVGSEIFRGKVHKRKNSIILYEPAESKNAATYECSILLNNGKYALEGVWTSKKENKIFYCRATKVADLTYAIDEPESTIRRLIESINTYSQNRNEDVLKNAYLLWLNPENRVGGFNSWKLGFSNTLSDSIPKFSNIPDSLKGDVSQNPQKIEGYSGVFAIVKVIHSAVEFFVQDDMVQKQFSTYEATYKLIVFSGSWYILGGKVRPLQRIVDGKKYTEEEFNNIY